jgi:hypothetical protein
MVDVYLRRNMTQAEFSALGHDVLRVAVGGGVLPRVIRMVSASPALEKVIERPDVLAAFGEGPRENLGQHDDRREGVLGPEDGSEGAVRGREISPGLNRGPGETMNGIQR